MPRAADKTTRQWIAMGDTKERWRQMERAGPVIPQPYKPSGGYRDACLLASTWAAARTVQQREVQPATAALVAAQVALYLKPKGYYLLQVGTNAHRVLDHGEWRRVAAGTMLHSNVPHLLGNCSRLVSIGTPMERELGTPGFAALAAASAAVSSGLYLLAARVAADQLPDSGLANKYFMSFPVGFSGALLALNVVGGYLGEVRAAPAGGGSRSPAKTWQAQPGRLLAGRLGCWPNLLLSHALAPKASLPGHVCGIGAGVLIVYAARGLRWLGGRLLGGGGGGSPHSGLTAQCIGLLSLGGAADHPSLGWKDLGCHALLAAATMLALRLMADRERGKRRAG